MVKIIETTGCKATCYSKTKEGTRGPIIAQVDDVTWRFDIEGMSADALAKYALAGLVIRNQTRYRTAILATRKEGYVGKNISQINADYKVQTIDVLKVFATRAAADPVGNIATKAMKLDDAKKAALIKAIQASMNK